MRAPGSRPQTCTQTCTQDDAAGFHRRFFFVPQRSRTVSRLQEMRAALQRWADHVERIVSGEALGNVVEMRGR